MSDDPKPTPEGTPPGTRKPTLPPGAKKPAPPPGTRKPSLPLSETPGGQPAGKRHPGEDPVSTTPAGTQKPAVPGAKKPKLPPGAKKPTLPPGSRKPTLPPGAAKKPLGPQREGVRRPAVPPAARTVPAGGDGAVAPLSRKDFSSDSDVRWCPGCGDYAVLAAVQRVLPDLVETKHKTVFVSGIGCSSRFPYYMDTFGIHSIHGRAPAVATGLKAANPELDVWVITGDGDALSIGGNHFAHLLRRNVDCQVLLFNNQIYGLTKGQYSPTSEPGKVTKSSPYGSLDHPFNPVALALGADATFVARTLDRDPKHMHAMLKRAHAHRGTALVEVYQNCNIFNDGAFERFSDREARPRTTLYLEHGQPMTWDEGRMGYRLDGLKLVAVDLTAGDFSASDCLVYDETDRTMASMLSRVFWDPELPQPFGVFYTEDRPCYDALLDEQAREVRAKRGTGDLKALLRGPETWTIG